jgi:hypothetical protein
VNVYLRLWLTCLLLSTSCSWRLYWLQISGVSLTLSPSGFVYLEFSWAQQPLLHTFPFPSTLGKAALHPPSPVGIFIYSSCGKWPFPLLLWSFPPTVTFTSFPTPRLLVGCCYSWHLHPACLFTVPWGIAPPLLFSTQGAPPFLLCVFFVIVVYYSVCFFSFFPGWGSVCPGGYADLAQGCLWEYCMLLRSPGGLRLPKRSGSWCLAAREPSWFLHLTWTGDAVSGLGCGGVRILSLLSGFSCKVYHPPLSKILF